MLCCAKVFLLGRKSIISCPLLAAGRAQNLAYSEAAFFFLPFAFGLGFSAASSSSSAGSTGSSWGTAGVFFLVALDFFAAAGLGSSVSSGAASSSTGSAFALRPRGFFAGSASASERAFFGLAFAAGAGSSASASSPLTAFLARDFFATG